MTYIEETWKEEQIQEFKNSYEREATISQHFGMGMFLRNTWISNHNESDNIQQFFNDFSIFHFDDMSSIILTSYHRELNNNEIQLQEQTVYFVEYWKEINDCKQKQTDRALEYFKKFSINDSIIIKMPLKTKNDAKNYSCFTEWEKHDTTSLLVNGILVNKINEENSNELIFKVLILSRSIKDVKIYGNTLWLYDTLDVYLKSSWRIYPWE